MSNSRASLKPEPPIFILSHARTGSTLLRYLLDSHPDIAAPAEIELGRLCASLRHTIKYSVGKTGCVTTQSEIAAKIRCHVDGVMSEYCSAKGKRRWCDKSISNMGFLGVLTQVFPDARYVCLHRTCLDVVQSCLDAFRFGYHGQLLEYVVRQADNVVDAIVHSWNERTRCLLEFEHLYAHACLRIRYEDIVAETELALQRILNFVNVENSGWLFKTAFAQSHDSGPGDTKIRSTSGVHAHSVGCGDKVPAVLIAPQRWREMNSLLRQLGYPAVTLQDRGHQVQADSLTRVAAE